MWENVHGLAEKTRVGDDLNQPLAARVVTAIQYNEPFACFSTDWLTEHPQQRGLDNVDGTPDWTMEAGNIFIISQPPLTRTGLKNISLSDSLFPEEDESQWEYHRPSHCGHQLFNSQSGQEHLRSNVSILIRCLCPLPFVFHNKPVKVLTLCKFDCVKIGAHGSHGRFTLLPARTRHRTLSTERMQMKNLPYRIRPPFLSTVRAWRADKKMIRF